MIQINFGKKMDEIAAPVNWTLSADPSDGLEPELSLPKKLQLTSIAVLLTFLVSLMCNEIYFKLVEN